MWGFFVAVSLGLFYNSLINFDIAKNLLSYQWGYNNYDESKTRKQDLKKGRVVKSTGSWYQVWTENGSEAEQIECRLPGRFRLQKQNRTNPLAVGDRVMVTMNEDNTGTIVDILERENALPRITKRGNFVEQIIAANIDLAVAVQSIRKPHVKQGFIDRFLVTCEAYDIEPLIVINKTDLATDKDRNIMEHYRKMYSSLGYKLLFTSNQNEASLKSLKSELKDKTSVFVGHSGVGKSSLLNAMDPSLARKIGEISRANQKGKHTTTYAELINLKFGGWLIDTPGIREFGLLNIDPKELWLFFPEMNQYGNDCKFHDCTHVHEPGCAVMEAFEQGKIDPARYDSYLNILESLQQET